MCRGGSAVHRCFYSSSVLPRPFLAWFHRLWHPCPVGVHCVAGCALHLPQAVLEVGVATDTDGPRTAQWVAEARAGRFVGPWVCALHRPQAVLEVGVATDPDGPRSAQWVAEVRAGSVGRLPVAVVVRRCSGARETHRSARRRRWPCPLSFTAAANLDPAPNKVRARRGAGPGGPGRPAMGSSGAHRFDGAAVKWRSMGWRRRVVGARACHRRCRVIRPQFTDTGTSSALMHARGRGRLGRSPPPPPFRGARPCPRTARGCPPAPARLERVRHHIGWSLLNLEF